MTSKAIEQAGRALYGEQWQMPLARALNMQGRTMQRIAYAARQGQDYQVSPGVVRDLYRLLEEREREVVAARHALRDRELAGG